MGAEEMAHANWRLDNPPVVDVAVSRRMGLFVVARLAARHGIRVRLRPASMGGLTALVWLPDEAITYETAAVPPGLRRFETASTAAAAGSAMPAGVGVATVPPPQNRQPPVLGAPAAAAPATTEASQDLGFLPGGAPLASDSRPTVIMPPVPSTAEETRLPIFESVESDWFRRGRHAAEWPAAVAPTEGWSSPADAGWRAAEVANSPVSGGTTAAGLPVRVPKANLVPGTVSPATAPPPPAPARSAAQVQERLASFQQGIRTARAAAPGTDDLGQDGQPGGEEDDATREAELCLPAVASRTCAVARAWAAAA
jgi:hypothetical protein